MVKLVDTKDLNPCPFGSASSSLAEGTTLEMKKILIISDKNSKSLIIKKLLKKFLKNSLIKKVIDRYWR